MRAYQIIQNRADFDGIKTKYIYTGGLSECRKKLLELVEKLNKREDCEAWVHDDDFAEYQWQKNEDTSFDYQIHIIEI